MGIESDQSSVRPWPVQPIKELSSVAGQCAERGCALIRQLANYLQRSLNCCQSESIDNVFNSRSPGEILTMDDGRCCCCCWWRRRLNVSSSCCRLHCSLTRWRSSWLLSSLTRGRSSHVQLWLPFVAGAGASSCSSELQTMNKLTMTMMMMMMINNNNEIERDHLPTGNKDTLSLLLWPWPWPMTST